MLTRDNPQTATDSSLGSDMSLSCLSNLQKMGLWCSVDKRVLSPFISMTLRGDCLKSNLPQQLHLLWKPFTIDDFSAMTFRPSWSSFPLCHTLLPQLLAAQFTNTYPGLKVKATFLSSHRDRFPLPNLGSTGICILNTERRVNERQCPHFYLQNQQMLLPWACIL